jgi:exodeoxyribonuclease VII large subunit
MIFTSFENDPSAQPSERRVYSVSELTRDLKSLIEGRFPPVWVEGEISNFIRHTSGHLYFTLKDRDAQLSCVMWRGRNQSLVYQPQDGMKAIAMGNLTVYEKQGRYQLDVILLQPAGIGDLQLAFEALKKKLEKEGLFDLQVKKPIPEFPETVGVVTSPTGAAIRDIVSVIHRRFPAVEIILRPARVQGEGSAEDIADGIRELNAYGKPDVLIVGRGGGSLEDLWAFNEETVARAIFESDIPVVSAVGHEIDFTISDFVADMRAPTPSAAAELVVQDKNELRQVIMTHGRKMAQSVFKGIESRKSGINALLKSHALHIPRGRIREYRFRLDDTEQSVRRFCAYRVEAQRLKFSRVQARLLALNPEGVLKRGYSITTRARDGHVVTQSGQVKAGEALKIRLAKGSIQSTVNATEED